VARVTKHVGDQLERPSGVARADGLGQLEHVPLARFWYQFLDLGSGDATAFAGVDLQLFQRLHQAAQIGAGRAGQASAASLSMAMPRSWLHGR